jgi:hypothetical protein
MVDHCLVEAGPASKRCAGYAEQCVEPLEPARARNRVQAGIVPGSAGRRVRRPAA